MRNRKIKKKKKDPRGRKKILTSRVKPFVASAHKVTSVPSRMRDGGRDGVEEEEGRKAKKKKKKGNRCHLLFSLSTNMMMRR